jgi:RNA polymerase-binding transcription factor DksA
MSPANRARLDAKTLHDVATLLGERREQLIAHLQLASGDIPAEAAGDPQEMPSVELARARAEQIRAQLLETQSALDRLDDGTYGCCDRCDKRIAVERLLAVPHTVTCASCAP